MELKQHKARVKRIMQSVETTPQVSSGAAKSMGVASQIFLKKLVDDAVKEAKVAKSSCLEVEHLYKAIKSHDIYDFLQEVEFTDHPKRGMKRDNRRIPKQNKLIQSELKGIGEDPILINKFTESSSTVVANNPLEDNTEEEVDFDNP